MKIWMNASMSALLKLGSTSEVKLDPVIVERLQSRLTEHEGCLVFADNLEANPHLKRSEQFDDSGFESIINKTHLYERTVRAQPAELGALAAQALGLLERNLRENASGGLIKIMVTVASGGEFPSATIRFYRYRDQDGDIVDLSGAEDSEDGLLLAELEPTGRLS